MCSALHCTAGGGVIEHSAERSLCDCISHFACYCSCDLVMNTPHPQLICTVHTTLSELYSADHTV